MRKLLAIAPALLLSCAGYNPLSDCVDASKKGLIDDDTYKACVKYVNNSDPEMLKQEEEWRYFHDSVKGGVKPDEDRLPFRVVTLPPQVDAPAR